MLTLENFAPLVGEQFSLYGSNEGAAESDSLNGSAQAALPGIPAIPAIPAMPAMPIALCEARALGGPPFAGRHPYALLFEGPAEPLLPQHIYRVEHPALGALDLFLVPIGRAPSGIHYEAIFT